MTQSVNETCPRCRTWRVTHQIAIDDGYAATCINCLTPDERAAIDAADTRTGNLEEEPAHG